MIDSSVFIAPGAHVIGNVKIGPGSSVWFGSVIRADLDCIEIGRGCNVQDGSIIHVSSGFPVILGDYVSVAHGAILHGCHVEDGALIGMGAIVLDGAHIGRQAVIGAGSLVLANTTIPAGSLVFGQPAHVVRELSEAELEKYGKIADRYVENAKRWHSQK